LQSPARTEDALGLERDLGRFLLRAKNLIGLCGTGLLTYFYHAGVLLKEQYIV